MLFLTLALSTFLVMEGLAHVLHRYVMHGPLWFLHADHHQPGRKLEANDLFGLVGALVSASLIVAGSAHAPLLVPIGLGMAAYGAAYFVLHDLLVHRRLRLIPRPRRGYLHRLVQAHLLHHATHGEQGSYGFVVVTAAAAEARPVRR